MSTQRLRHGPDFGHLTDEISAVASAGIQEFTVSLLLHGSDRYTTPSKGHCCLPAKAPAASPRSHILRIDRAWLGHVLGIAAA
jgi:hypothetical protein